MSSLFFWLICSRRGVPAAALNSANHSNGIACPVNCYRKIVTNMRVSLPECKNLVRAIAPSGNLFLVLLLQELRRQGITFIAFYVLQRVIEAPGISQFQLRRETGLEHYEISRDCKFLADSGLIKIGRTTEDRRVGVLRRTNRGVKIRGPVVSKSAKQV